jgi:hypothetical protein
VHASAEIYRKAKIPPGEMRVFHYNSRRIIAPLYKRIGLFIIRYG